MQLMHFFLISFKETFSIISSGFACKDGNVTLNTQLYLINKYLGLNVFNYVTDKNNDNCSDRRNQI